MLDDVVADRPACMDANDYHSVWVNTAGLRALGIDRTTADPEGGEIVRDEDGEPTGELRETAVFAVWSHLAEMRSAAEHDAHLSAALGALAAAGVTSAIDMALDPSALAAMARAEQAGTLTARLRGHWLLDVDDAEDGIATGAAHARTHASPWLRVVGVKIVCDGVIDSCTAAMTKPFANGAWPPPIWSREVLVPAVAAADAAGLQIAIHAIGDAANRLALDAFEEAAANGSHGRRHRIEHAEYVDPVDVSRFGVLGVTASMQPAHADPAIRDNWAAMLGDERAALGYRWADLEAHTALVFGTDAPTAPHEALRNLFVATTRRSAIEPGLGEKDDQPAIPLDRALRHATIDAAWSCGDETERGAIRPGMLADLALLDRDPFGGAPDSLLEASVVRTVVGGRVVFEA
jgi:predicted amidohydrolase YtcJ